MDNQKKLIWADYIKHFKMEYIALSLYKDAISDVYTFSLIPYVLFGILNACIFLVRVRVQQ
jgi:hypothetical protein